MSELTETVVSSEPPPCSWASVTVRDGVAEVVLTAQGKASRQGPDFWLTAPALFSWFDQSEAVRCVLVRGGGDGFSHGLDLAAMSGDLMGLVSTESDAKRRTALHQLITRMQRAITCVADCRTPVVAAVHGWCIGAGVDLISACDVRLCSVDAKFSVREVKLAIVADVGSLARLPAIIGQGATRELALTGDDVDAARAKELGLVSRVLETHDALLAEARAMCQRIAANPPRVVEGIKQVLNSRSEPEARASLEHVAAWNAAFLPSKDLLEAMTAFMERRPPRFSGE